MANIQETLDPRPEPVSKVPAHRDTFPAPASRGQEPKALVFRGLVTMVKITRDPAREIGTRVLVQYLPS